jgi:hypothetical protein
MGKTGSPTTQPDDEREAWEIWDHGYPASTGPSLTRKGRWSKDLAVVDTAFRAPVAGRQYSSPVHKSEHDVAAAGQQPDDQQHPRRHFASRCQQQCIIL